MTELDAMKSLRLDAIARNMQELAIVYGWSAIRMQQQIVAQQLTDLVHQPAQREHRWS